MRPAFRVETWKMIRSRVVWVASSLMAVLIPLMALGMVWAAGRGSAGAVGSKIDVLVTAEGWPGYLDVVGQISAVAVFLGSGVVSAWVFGREFVDRTFPSLFARAVSRGSIASAKLVVLMVWVVLLTAAMAVVTFLLGLLGAIGPFEVGEVATELVMLVGVTFGAGLLGLTGALVASAGRGYLPAIGVLIVLVAIAQVAVLLGTGGWFPFAVPGLLAVSGTEGAPELSGVQVALLPPVVGAVCWATVKWWRSAEVA